MHDESRGLVDDEEVLVLVRDPEVHLLADDVGRRGSRRFELHLLSPREPVALRLRCAVDAHVACGEEALGCRARADLRQPGEEAVEPLARRGVRNA
jgi:hypothetical protein